MTITLQWITDNEDNLQKAVKAIVKLINDKNTQFGHKILEIMEHPTEYTIDNEKQKHN